MKTSLTEVRRLISMHDISEQRRKSFRELKDANKNLHEMYRGVPLRLSKGHIYVDLTREEEKMIMRILENTITERAENLKEALEAIDIRV